MIAAVYFAIKSMIQFTLPISERRSTEEMTAANVHTTREARSWEEKARTSRSQRVVEEEKEMVTGKNASVERPGMLNSSVPEELEEEM